MNEIEDVKKLDGAILHRLITHWTRTASDEDFQANYLQKLDKAAQQICQLFEPMPIIGQHEDPDGRFLDAPKPDESLLITKGNEHTEEWPMPNKATAEAIRKKTYEPAIELEPDPSLIGEQLYQEALKPDESRLLTGEDTFYDTRTNIGRACRVAFTRGAKAQDAKTASILEARHQKEIANLKNANEALRRERGDEVWYWQGDGYDHPENLCCPILIEPEDLILIFKQHQKEIGEIFRELEKWHTMSGVWHRFDMSDNQYQAIKSRCIKEKNGQD